HLYGLGVDLAPDGPARVKLYVRADAQQAPRFLDGLRPQVRAPLDELLSRFDHPSLSPSLELAFALKNGERTVKLTRFWAGKQITREEQDALARWIDELCGKREALDRGLASLRAPSPAAIQKSALHAIGLEVGERAEPKVNVYLQPEL
ncbi:MAG: hypothetical protein AAFQ82_04985, partial [Myxococcota bacterium]